jgi:hypothetical protein
MPTTARSQSRTGKCSQDKQVETPWRNRAGERLFKCLDVVHRLRTIDIGDDLFDAGSVGFPVPRCTHEDVHRHWDRDRREFIRSVDLGQRFSVELSVLKVCDDPNDCSIDKTPADVSPDNRFSSEGETAR